MTPHFTSKAGTAKTKAMFNDRRFFFEKRNDRKQQNAGEKQIDDDAGLGRPLLPNPVVCECPFLAYSVEKLEK